MKTILNARPSGLFVPTPVPPGPRPIRKYHAGPNQKTIPAANATQDLLTGKYSLTELARKYGVTKQAISLFRKTRGLPKPARKSHLERCKLCQDILKIAADPGSDFITKKTVLRRLGGRINYHTFSWHLGILRRAGLISHSFAFPHSLRVEKAYRLYLTKAIPVAQIGRLTGIGNFASVIHRHRHKGGHVIPPSLFVYDYKERSKRSRRRRKIIGND